MAFSNAEEEVVLDGLGVLLFNKVVNFLVTGRDELNLAGQRRKDQMFNDLDADLPLNESASSRTRCKFCVISD